MIYNYSQPLFYRFDEATLNFSKYILEKEHNCLDGTILDLCAGSGVIGIEVASVLKQKLFLCEEEGAYLPYLYDNVYLSGLPLSSFHIYVSSVFDFNLNNKCDLILCNPPFYSRSRGRLPVDSRRCNARFYREEFFDQLADCLVRHSHQNTRIYLLLTKDNDDQILKLQKRFQLGVKTSLDVKHVILELGQPL